MNRSDDDNSNTLKVMTIGNNNVFEVDCLVESRNIGDNNVVESKGLHAISEFRNNIHINFFNYLIQLIWEIQPP